MSTAENKNKTLVKNLIDDTLKSEFDIKAVYSSRDVVEAGRELLKNGQIEDAILVLAKAQQAWPRNIAVNGVLAECYHKNNNNHQALTTYREIFDSNLAEEIPFWALVGYANALERHGDVAGAARNLNDALRKRFGLDLSVRAIHLARQIGWAEEVAGAIVEGVEKVPYSESELIQKPLIVVGDCFSHGGFYPQALQFYRIAQERGGSATMPVTRQLKYLIRNNKISLAKTLIDSWKRQNNDDDKLKRFDNILLSRTTVQDVRSIAFYLPQYHPVPENDAWWGEGFTEWRNVASAKPLWNGHCQPRLPTDLGYYDLRLVENYNKQTRLATTYGVDGFCFYYYWFNGRKILEKPLENVLSGKADPFPFCICWVNEDWTRSWDGMTGEVLLSTEHSLEMNNRFIEDVYPIISNENYIKIDNKPALIVYCAEKLDKTPQTTNSWRQYCRQQGLGDIYLIAVQSFGFGDPTSLGFDAALEFPPHAIKTADGSDSHQIAEIEGAVPDFNGTVYSYQQFADCAMQREREQYRLYRTAMLAWDNTARRGKQAHVYAHFSIEKYQQWLLCNMQKAMSEHQDPVVFINAWNEWAEGSVLEPDTEYGHESLAATSRAKRIAKWNTQDTYWQPSVNETLLFENTKNRKVLMVGHDAHKNGAQINFLCMLQNLVREQGMRVAVVLKEGGELLSQYQQYGDVCVLSEHTDPAGMLYNVARDYYSKGIKTAICNTSVTGDITTVLNDCGYGVVSLVHELPGLINEYGLLENCKALVKNAKNIVFASDYVAEKFTEVVDLPESKVQVIPQGIKKNNFLINHEQSRKEVREEFGIPESAIVVVGCGYGDIRKGMDLFVRLAAATVRQEQNIYFVWIGDIEQGIRNYIERDIQEVKMGHLVVTGYREDTGRILCGADIFALTSREDPFPSVVMEAMEAGLAVYGFEGCGGYASIVNDKSGGIVPFGDIDSYVSRILGCASDSGVRQRMAEHNKNYAQSNFGYTKYMKSLCYLADHGVLPAESSDGLRVSVVVPNYNYAKYLQLRLHTIANQTRKPDEIIILDDCSSDSSADVIEKFRSSTDIDVVVVENEVNSGSVFKQWKNGLELARYELAWIAEADDYCDQDFLARMCLEFESPEKVMSFCNSVMVDDIGGSYGEAYDGYYQTVFEDYFNSDFDCAGRSFINDVLCRRNAVMNASAVVFRLDAAGKAIDNLGSLNLSGDWKFWVDLSLEGQISYVKKPLNYHRRHQNSVMGKALKLKTEVVEEMLHLLQHIVELRDSGVTDEAILSSIREIESTYKEMFPDIEKPMEQDKDIGELYKRLLRTVEGGRSAPVTSCETIADVA